MAAARNKFEIGIHVGITTALVGLVLITTLGLSVAIFLRIQGILREDLRKQLYNTVAVGALLIDGDLHESLHDPSDRDSTAYHTLQRALVEIRGRALEIEYVYTMRLTDTGTVEFVVDAETNPDYVSEIGEEYPDPTPELLASLQGAGIQIEREFAEDDWGVWLSGFAPVFGRDGVQVGVLGIDMAAEGIIANERQTLLGLIVIAAVITALVMIASIILSRWITAPLALLERDMQKIKRFQIDDEIQVTTAFREIRTMADVTENLKESLQSFKRYVPADLVAELIAQNRRAELGGARKDLTILFSDIENFTTWSETLSPEDLISIMAKYFAGMTEIIMRNHGTVDKYIGDAIMAFWGAPRELEDHATHACRAAVECIEFQHSLTAELSAQGFPPLNTRFGINSGEVLVGNVGYENRLNYTVLGDHVNLASRLEGLNKYYGTNIIISDDTAQRVQGSFHVRALDAVAVKGKSAHIRIHELRGVSSGKPEEFEARFTEIANRATQLYFSRHWVEALPLFEKLRAARPNDRTSEVMAKRCRELIQTDPGPDWGGYVVMRDK